jgi:hypothetical protein
MFRKIRDELSSRRYQFFLVGLVVMLEHLLEDALVHKENGASLAAQIGSSALTVALVGAGAAAYPLLRRGRPILVGFFGLLALSGGWRAHVTDALKGDATGGDYSGVVYALGGIILLGLFLLITVELLARRGASADGRSSAA